MENEICVAVAGGGRYHVCEEQESRFADDCFETFAKEKSKLLRCLEGWSELSRGQADCHRHHPSLQRSIAQIGLSQEPEPTSAWQFLASLEDAWSNEFSTAMRKEVIQFCRSP